MGRPLSARPSATPSCRRREWSMTISSPAFAIASSSGPGRSRSFLLLTVDVDGIDLFVVEAEQVLDLGTFGNRRRIAPDDVLEFLPVHRQAPVGGDALVRASRVRVGGRQ